MPRWLLLSDLHFKHRDLDRVRQAASWIVEQAARLHVSRAVVCGDLLTSRAMQPTHVLSACYRFIGELSEAVPRVNILLGNHDLAYRRNYETTALAALGLRRLSPFVSLHTAVERHEWDGRSVLLLPFREDQTELTGAVAALAPKEARSTVAFGHLAIHKAITQRHVIRPTANFAGLCPTGGAVTHRGLTGPHHFAAMARTFTGHFHSHQTITQGQTTSYEAPPADANLQGSITYIGSPLQLTWADLHDEQRGVVLLDPATLEHRLLVNPHAVHFTTVDVHAVLNGRADEDNLVGKHVMLRGELTRQKYAMARDKLVSIGARSVRDWHLPGIVTHADYHGSFGGELGVSVPASDAGDQPHQGQESGRNSATADPCPSAASDDVPESPARAPDLGSQVQEFVGSILLSDPLSSRRDDLSRLGERIVAHSHLSPSMTGEWENDIKTMPCSYRNLLHGTPTAALSGATSGASEPCRDVFLGEPLALTITNFMGVDGTVRFHFKRDISRGVTLITGDNGAGKSTLLEAMTWCQFGRCIRTGVSVDGVVNDVAKKNCSVELEFANGWSITRHRGHKVHANRVVVSHRGEPQPSMEGADARATQAAVEELLGIDYDRYVRTVVLSHESVTGFLSSTTAQRRELIEPLLGLEMLDCCWRVSRAVLRVVETDIDDVRRSLKYLEQTREHAGTRVDDMLTTHQRLKRETEEAAALVEETSTMLDLATSGASSSAENVEDGDGPSPLIDLERQAWALEGNISATEERVRRLQQSAKLVEIRRLWVNEALRVKVRISEELQHGRRALERVLGWEEQIRTVSLSTDLLSLQQTRLIYLIDRETNVCAVKRGHVLARLSHATKLWSLRIQLAVLVRAASMLGKPLPDTEKRAKEGQEALLGFVEDAAARTGRIAELEQAASPPRIVATVATAFGVKQTFVDRAIHAAGGTFGSSDQAGLPAIINEQIERAKGSLSALRSKLLDIREQQQQEQKRAREAQREQRRQREADQQDSARRLGAAQKQLEVSRREEATYAHQLEAEQASLGSVKADYDVLAAKLATLSDLRELAAFWTAAFAKRSRRAAATGSSPTTTTTTFREFLLAQSLQELNGLLVSAIATLYRDTRHARTLTEGMLSSLFDGQDGTTPSVIDSTLSISSSLAYAKRSSGERKRIDLALFFALLQLGRARTRHRARYLLVDEVFDSLDAAGQRVAVRWCKMLVRSGVVDHIVIITHSSFLADEYGGRSDVAVLRQTRSGLRGLHGSSGGVTDGVVEQTGARQSEGKTCGEM